MNSDPTPSEDTKKSPYLYGVLYFNSGDARLLVPKRLGTGITVNLAHRACDLFLSGILAALVVGGALAIGFPHLPYLRAHPHVLTWIGLSGAAAVALFHLNFSRVCLFSADAGFLGYGALACLLGFTVQSLVNGLLISKVVGASAGWKAHLLYGPGAAVCQTLGKLAFIALILRVRPPLTSHKVLAAGIMVGLGFAIMEILVLGGNIVATETVVSGWSGVVERGIAALFHIFSAGLIAIGWRQRRWLPIAAVLLAHAVTDFFAGAAGAGLALPFEILESIFLVVAILTWLGFRFYGSTDAIY